MTDLESDSEGASESETDGAGGTEGVHAGDGGGTLAQARARRPKRQATYDETTRRKARRTREVAYLERGQGRGAKRNAIVLGPAAIERIVGGRYEWRDAGYKRPRRA